MADLPVTLGPLEAVPPALRYRIGAALALLPRKGSLEGRARERLVALLDDGLPWFGAEPALADVGLWMLEASHGIELRRCACAWLAAFPVAAVIKRLAEVALDAATPAPVREAAIAALGDRELRVRHPSTLWSPEALQLADETLVKLADAATTTGVVTPALSHALRHVAGEALAAVLARAPGLWGDAVECFATPPLARVLFVSLDEIPTRHRLRTLRLACAVLGEETVPMLLARAKGAGELRLEMLLLAISCGGEAHLPRLEDALRELAVVELVRNRAKWHLANRGVISTVRGLRIARVTAALPIDERAAKCAQAADDLGALAKFARHPEPYLYEMWAWAVRGSGEPAKARELVAVHPESAHHVRELYLEELARRGRVKQLMAAAQALDAADVGALGLAIHGRPLAALELAATARVHTAELVCARALACYRAGRSDLTERILVEDLPAPEITNADELGTFPGANERWQIEHATRPAITALANGRAGVIAIAKPAPHDAEPDVGSFDAAGTVVRRLARKLAGATVYLAGELDRKALAKALEAAGARLVGGPFPGTDFYVLGARCPVQTIAQLARQGARRLRVEEI